MDQYADDLVGLLDVLHIDRAVMAGLSMGGYVAFALWRRHPQRVRGLVLCNTRAGADSEEGREKRRKLIATAREQGMGPVADAQLTGHARQDNTKQQARDRQRRASDDFVDSRSTASWARSRR